MVYTGNTKNIMDQLKIKLGGPLKSRGRQANVKLHAEYQFFPRDENIHPTQFETFI